MHVHAHPVLANERQRKRGRQNPCTCKNSTSMFISFLPVDGFSCRRTTKKNVDFEPRLRSFAQYHKTQFNKICNFITPFGTFTIFKHIYIQIGKYVVLVRHCICRKFSPDNHYHKYCIVFCIFLRSLFDHIKVWVIFPLFNICSVFSATSPCRFVLFFTICGRKNINL